MSTENVAPTQVRKPLNNRLEVPTILEMIKSIPTIRHEWRLKSPFQKWCYFYGIGRGACTLNCFPLFRENPAVNWFTYYPVFYFWLYVVMVLCNAYYFIIVRGQFTKALPSTCLLTLTIPSIPFIHCMFSKDIHKYRSLVDFAGLYVYPDNRDDAEYSEICSKQIDITVKRFLIKYFVMFVSGFLAIAGTVNAYIIHGIKTTTTDLRIPFTEEGSNDEFVINILYQLNFYIHGTTIYLGIEVLMSIIENLMTLSPKLVEKELEKLNAKQQSQELSDQQVLAWFNNAVKRALDTQDYIAWIKEFLYERFLVTPILFTYAIGMSICCQYMMNYPAGYGMALMSYVQLFYICEVGGRIEDNGFADILYESNWYTLPVKLQKDLMHLNNYMQNGQKITVGPFSTINRELFKANTNNIYTLVMFLINFEG